MTLHSFVENSRKKIHRRPTYSEKLKLQTMAGHDISGISSDTDAEIHYFVSKKRLRQPHQHKKHFTAQLGFQGQCRSRFQTECCVSDFRTFH